MASDWARPVVHWEIVARDPELLREFYRRLFNWQIGDGPLMAIPAGIGGPEGGPAGHIREGEHGGVVLYVQVRDLRASLAAATELGAKGVTAPVHVPGGPTVAGVQDPEGNTVMLVQQ